MRNRCHYSLHGRQQPKYGSVDIADQTRSYYDTADLILHLVAYDFLGIQHDNYQRLSRHHRTEGVSSTMCLGIDSGRWWTDLYFISLTVYKVKIRPAKH
jgi:hypothetical protein